MAPRLRGLGIRLRVQAPLLRGLTQLRGGLRAGARRPFSAPLNRRHPPELPLKRAPIASFYRFEGLLAS